MFTVVNMKLRNGVRCPIHRSLSCCGRSEPLRKVKKGWTQIRPGVSRIEDPNHSRGYRERRSPAELRKLVDRKIEEQQNLCWYCKKPFEDYRDVTPEHIEPRGIGGAWRDDHPDNIAATHSWCNREKGSKRVAGLERVQGGTR